MFPLRLTPFEESFLVDDPNGQQLDILARLEFEGVADRAALQAAFQIAVERHPLVAANVHTTRWGRFEWVTDPNYAPSFEWVPAGETAPLFPPESVIYARDGIPLRLTVQTSSTQTAVIFHCHHTRLDGVGTFQFLGDIFVGYARTITGPAAAPLPPLEPRRLLSRHKFGLNAWRLLRRIPRLAIGLQGVRQFVARRPARFYGLAAPAQSSSMRSQSQMSAPSKTQILELDESISSAFLATARRLKVTFNDLLARDLFLAINTWRTERGDARPDDWIRLMVPLNMRRADDATMPAANVVSTIYLDRTPRDCAAPEQLLHSLHDEMKLIKDRDLGLIFLLTLAGAGLVPGGIARLTKKQDCVATAVFSNVMRPVDQWPLPRSDGRLKSGNLVLRDLEIYAPLRRNTSVTCAVLSYAQRLRLCLRFDSQVFTPAEFMSFTDCLRAQILSTLHAGDGPR